MKLSVEIPSLKGLNWGRGLARSFFLAWALGAWGAAYLQLIDSPAKSSPGSFSVFGGSPILKPMDSVALKSARMLRETEDRRRELGSLPPLPVSKRDFELAMGNALLLGAGEDQYRSEKTTKWLLGPVTLPGLLLLGWWTVRGFRRDETTTPREVDPPVSPERPVQ